MLGSELEIAWAAGLFEGEGSIGINHQRKKNGRMYCYTRLTMGMSDEDVVRRFHRIMGCGTIYHHIREDGYKDMWHWHLQKRDKVENIIAEFWPYLGERRRAKVIELDLLP